MAGEPARGGHGCIPQQVNLLAEADSFMTLQVATERLASSGASTKTGARGAKTAEKARLKRALMDIAEVEQPLSVRNAFYRMLSLGHLPKTEQAYRRVLRLKRDLCYEHPRMWSWFNDGSRSYFRNTGFSGLDDTDFHDEVSRLYRRDLWRHTDLLIQVWCESRSIAPALAPVAREMGVDLYPSGGMTSDSYLYSAARTISLAGRDRVLVLYVGDLDPTGLDIDRNITSKLEYFLGLNAESWGENTLNLEFVRLAVTLEQVRDMDLPTKPVKGSQTRNKHGLSKTTEAEAIPAPALREILTGAVEGFVPDGSLAVLRAAEESERSGLRQLLREWGQSAEE